MRSAGDRELVRRIEAELAAGTWNSVHDEPEASLAHAPLRELARAHAAVAALRLDGERAELELWVAGHGASADGSTDRLAIASASERVLALQVVEMLRARLLALERAQPATIEGRTTAAETAAATEADNETETAAETAAETETAETAAETETAETAAETEASSHARADASERGREPSLPSDPAWLWLELAPALTYSPGGLDPAFHGWFGLRVQPAALWSLAGFALIPISRERVARDEGSAGISNLLFGLGAWLHFARSTIELAAGAGLSGVVSFTRGDAGSGYSGHEDTAFAPAPFVGTVLHLPLGGGVRVYVRAVVGATLPRMSLRFAERDAALWGVPFVTAGLGIELAIMGRDPPREP